MIATNNTTDSTYLGPPPENLTYFTNFTSEGASRFRPSQTLNAELPAYLRIAATTVCAVILTLGTAGNVLVATVVWKTKELRNSTNLFLINLSVADLLVLLVCVPPVLLELHEPEVWLLGEGMLNRFLASKNIPVAPQPPYSPDLNPWDFFLFPKLKNHLKGHHFGTLENIQTAVTDQLKAILISEFHQCYEEWKKRLQRCVASEGSYFEGDNVEL
ncbi:putative transposase [Trichonephila clavipes]|nr:putative transposase [Trichonephila clavipes]